MVISQIATDRLILRTLNKINAQGGGKLKMPSMWYVQVMSLQVEVQNTVYYNTKSVTL